MKSVWKSPWTKAVGILVLTLLAYLPAPHAQFIWDDDILITANPMIRAGDGLYRMWFSTGSLDYWPLTSTLWWLEWRLWGDHPTGYHVVSIFLHALNSVLIWKIMERLKIPGALFAALVFAVHPVNVATVAWISEQKNTLAMLFYLLAILSYLRFDKIADRRWYIISLTAFLLALLSKAAVVMLPVVLLGCLWWEAGYVRRKDILNCAPFFVLSLCAGLMTLWFQHKEIVQANAVPVTSLAYRLVVTGWTPWFYLYTAILPFNLMVIYPRWHVDVANWMAYAPGIAWLICFSILWWRRRTWGRPLLFGLGYFVVMLLPVSGFFPQAFHRHSWVADHWQYFSIVGVIGLLVGMGAMASVRPGSRPHPMGITIGIVVLLILALTTQKRCRIYADEGSLWSDNAARNPEAWVVQNNLGLALWQTGNNQEAMEHLRHAVRLEPDYAVAHVNLGNALLQSARLGPAISEYELAVKLNPDLSEAYYNLGNALSRAHRYREAIPQYESVLRGTPNSDRAHYHLAVALEHTGRHEEAVIQYGEALRLNPNYTEARSALARLGAKP